MVANFALIVTWNPTAADIFKKDAFIGAGQFSVGALRRVKKPSWKECEGRIVSIGSQKYLKGLRVSEAGEIMQENDTSQPVQNRYQELLKQKKASQVTAKEKHLREVAKRLMDAGPSGLLNPQTGRSTLRLPKKFSAAHCAALKTELENLPCWTKKPGDVQLSLDHQVFLPGSALLIVQCTAESPSRLLMALLSRLLPPEIASNKALSRTGRRGTVKLPQALVEAANVSVLTWYKQQQKTVDFSLYRINTVVKNFLYYRQHPHITKDGVVVDAESSRVNAHSNEESSDDNGSVDDLIGSDGANDGGNDGKNDGGNDGGNDGESDGGNDGENDGGNESMDLNNNSTFLTSLSTDGDMFRVKSNVQHLGGFNY